MLLLFWCFSCAPQGSYCTCSVSYCMTMDQKHSHWMASFQMIRITTLHWLALHHAVYYTVCLTGYWCASGLAPPSLLPTVCMRPTHGQWTTTIVQWSTPSTCDWCSLFADWKISSSKRVQARYWSFGCWPKAFVHASMCLITWCIDRCELYHPTGWLFFQTGRQVPVYGEGFTQAKIKWVTIKGYPVVAS